MSHHAIVAALLLATATVAPPALALPKYKPLVAPVLEPERALLVLVVEAPLRVAEIKLLRTDGRGAATLVVDAPADAYTVRVYSLPIGRYRIAAVTLPTLRRAAFQVSGTPWLDLQGARINYAGDLVLEPDDEDLKGRLQNHSGRLVNALRAQHAALIAGAPFAYVGGEDDGWFRSGDAK